MTDLLKELREVMRLRDERVLAAKTGNDEAWNKLSEACENAMDSFIVDHHATIQRIAEYMQKAASKRAALIAAPQPKEAK
jgi:hypothetical protein